MVARSLTIGSFLAAVAAASPLSGNATTTPGGVVYTTEIVSSIVTYCPAATEVVHGSKTYTVTEATTLTITDCPCTVSKPVGPTYSAPAPGPEDKCAKECTNEYNACRVKPHANMSFCAAEYASCLGYSPFGNGEFVTPTACSAKPEKPTATPTTPSGVHYTTEVVQHLTTVCPSPTTVTYGSHTLTVSESTTLTVSDCSCTVSRPAPSPSGSVPVAPSCPEMCAKAYDMCRGTASANMAQCAADYANCLGYSPYGPDGSLIKPTACSQAPTGTAQPPAPTGPAASGPAPSAPAPTGPATTAPGVPATTPVVGSAGRVVPGAILALGAIALL
jgi:hypothetical protein